MSEEDLRARPAAAGPEPAAPDGSGRTRPARADDPYRTPDDTVSLRELYLVLRAGIPLIVVVAVVAGLLAFAYRARQPDSFTADAVVQVARPRVSAQPAAGLEVGVAALLDVEAYTAIAQARSTLERVMGALEVDDPADLGRLVVVPGPGPRSAEAFAVTHRVTGRGEGGAERAALVANAWADATIDVAREALVAPWSLANASVSEDVARREADYQSASIAWADFLAIDERGELRRRLEALVDLDTARSARLGELEAELAGRRARLSAGAGDRLALEADVAALEAEVEHLRGELAASSGQGDQLRARLGELERQATELQRSVSATSLAYFRAAPAEASLQLQQALASGAVGLVLPAAPPFEADGNDTLVTVIAAFLIGALAATLFVFLRAAVRDPDLA